jgi:hypothetical protein
MSHHDVQALRDANIPMTVEILEQLHRADELGYTIRFQDLAEHPDLPAHMWHVAGGWCDPENKVIGVRTRGQDPERVVAIMKHELQHALEWPDHVEADDVPELGMACGGAWEHGVRIA